MNNRISPRQPPPPHPKAIFWFLVMATSYVENYLELCTPAGNSSDELSSSLCRIADDTSCSSQCLDAGRRDPARPIQTRNPATSSLILFVWSMNTTRRWETPSKSYAMATRPDGPP